MPRMKPKEEPLPRVIPIMVDLENTSYLDMNYLSFPFAPDKLVNELKLNKRDVDGYTSKIKTLLKPAFSGKKFYPSTSRLYSLGLKVYVPDLGYALVFNKGILGPSHIQFNDLNDFPNNARIEINRKFKAENIPPNLHAFMPFIAQALEKFINSPEQKKLLNRGFSKSQLYYQSLRTEFKTLQSLKKLAKNTKQQ